MKALYEYLFKKVLTFLGGITADQWEKSKELVKKASIEFTHLSGAERRTWVISELKKLWGDLSPYLINLLVDGAYGLLKNAVSQ